MFHAKVFRGIALFLTASLVVAIPLVHPNIPQSISPPNFGDAVGSHGNPPELLSPFSPTSPHSFIVPDRTENPWDNIQRLIPSPPPPQVLYRFQKVFEDLCRLVQLSNGGIRLGLKALNPSAKPISPGHVAPMNIVDASYILAGRILQDKYSDIPKSLREAAEKFMGMFAHQTQSPSASVPTPEKIRNVPTLHVERQMAELAGTIAGALRELRAQLENQDSTALAHIWEGSDAIHHTVADLELRIIQREMEFAKMVSKLWYLRLDVKDSALKYLEYLKSYVPRRKSL